MNFDKLNEAPNFIKMQKEMLDFWEQDKTFQKSVNKKCKGEVVFYDGPPFPTGKPHHGTILVSFIKDMIARFQTMKGFSVPRIWGWDCHGLPIETQVEKNLMLSDKKDIENIIGIPQFNDECYKLVSQNNESWKEYVREMCRWTDYENAYKTMDVNFMESVIWAFKECYEKGLIYRDYRVAPYCCRCETSLSISDTRESDSTRPRQDTWVIARFLTDEKINNKPVYFLAWTTTPWTLPFNTALAVGKKFTYSFVEKEDCVYVAISSCLEKYKNIFGEQPTILKTCTGSEIEGKKYTPFFNCGSKLENAFRVISADYVSDEDGVGIVHIAPAFGEDDYWAAKANNIPSINFVDEKGQYTEEAPLFRGRKVLEVNGDMIRYLRTNSLIVAEGSLVHNYPHCWRCKEPLIYKAMDAWYFDISKIKEELIKKNAEVQWFPDFIKNGRFGLWLENARDWNISRNRYWSTPIPVWTCPKCGKIKVLGSIAEIEKESGIRVKNLHRQYLDEIKMTCDCGEEMSRVPEVLDCWFESGSVPFASKHYPFENKEWFENHSPSDFVVEYTGQIRCWFYYLHVLSVALFDKPAYKNCIVHGTVLAKDGKKLSKSSKNYTDPMELMKTYGTDAFRIYMYKSNAMLVNDMMFDEVGLKAAIQEFLLPLYNGVSFFTTYAKIDGFNPQEVKKPNSNNQLDKWILAKLYDVAKVVNDRMVNYQIDKVIEPLELFIDSLTNWYIRRSRRRFWDTGFSGDKKNAYETLYFVLIEFCKIIAPFTPIIAEYIFKNLTTNESVHLESFLSIDEKFKNEKLIKDIDFVRNVINLGRKLRAKNNIKVRQPLGELKVASNDSSLKATVIKFNDEIKEELNVKSIDFVKDINGIAVCTFLPNFAILKNTKPNQIGSITTQIRQKEFTFKENKLYLQDGTILTSEEFLCNFNAKEGFEVVTDGQVVVLLNTIITEELRLEGVSREIIRNIQEERKKIGCNIIEKIIVNFSPNVPSQWIDKICKETLSSFGEIDKPDSVCEFEINNEYYWIKIKRN